MLINRIEKHVKVNVPPYRFQGGLRQISVGLNSAWGVSADGRVLARIGISDESPMGREWSTVDADAMKHVIYIFNCIILLGCKYFCLVSC